MAVTVSIITPTAAAIPLGQEVNFTIRLSNSGASEVSVTNAVPYCAPSSEPTVIAPVAAQLGTVLIPANSPVSPGGILNLSFSAVFSNASSATASINVSSLVYFSDGTLATGVTNVHVMGSNNYGN